MKPHILLTSLGVQAIETRYQWDGKKVSAPLTPLALVQLLDPSQRPNRVVTIVTQKAKDKTWEIFQEGICQALGFKPESVLIPEGSSSDEVRQILEDVARCVPEGAELTLDVTQGMRHFPFIFYALVLYLTSLRGVKVRGAYYGMIEGAPPDEPKPIIDLRPLLELPEWFHAVRMFRDQGTTSAIAQLIQPLADKIGKETTRLFKKGDKIAGISKREQERQIKPAVEWLEKHAFAYEAALPLELGRASWQLIEPIQQLATTDSPGLPPLAAELMDTIADVAQKTAFAEVPANKGQWKKEVSLTADELKRQARMIDLYLKRGQLPLAVGLMREWVVSWMMMKSGNTENWLEHDNRQSHERRLGALKEFAIDPAFSNIVTGDQKAWGTFWNQLTNELRNALHHHAMRGEALEEPPKSLEAVRCFWDQLKAGEVRLPPLGGGGGRLLLSPQGTRPGVLFSALKVAEPDTCLVICSATSASSISEACEQAGFQGSIEQIELTDPHGGFDELYVSAEQARPYLLDSDEIVANMTGGTTLMDLVVQRLAEEAQRLDRPVRRLALIDRRPPAEQDSDPFVQGDCHWLDD